ncbi:anti-sigma factor domain-containing protein [Halobacillus salinarum]|uniref:Anti-sigma factor domain-containing protein n=1 Tax=Halobacillus salinarum TaxID=2932257 RepID=A0ABY4EHI3_9BACI|nr:anti-sigma factor domain-containing protein [Halobacillus salinarum]UOQ43591.1 anti-sigma factor domain-containing protein [Halobacillus salinarum]
MRKGIVMEQSKYFTIVMTNDGAFYKAKPIRAEVGMEVHFLPLVEPQQQRKWTFLLGDRHMKVIAIALVLLIAFLPVYLWYGSNKAYAYVNIDINPSVELKVNDHMKVIDIQTLNSDAEDLVSHLKNWKKRSASEVALEMIQLSKKYGYMNSKQEVLIGISYLQSEHKQDFKSEIETYLSTQSNAMTIAAYDVPDKVRKQAQKERASVNEVMARTIEEGTKAVANKSVSQTVEIEDDDKAIIQSFYHKDHDSKKNEAEDQTNPPATPVEKPEIVSGKENEEKPQIENQSFNPDKQKEEKLKAPKSDQGPKAEKDSSLQKKHKQSPNTHKNERNHGHSKSKSHAPLRDEKAPMKRQNHKTNRQGPHHFNNHHK